MQSQPQLQKTVSEESQQSFFIFSSSTMLDAWKEVGSWASSSSFPAKTRLFLQGAWPQAVYLIERGLVKLLAMDSEGQEVFIGIYSQGFLLGANAALLQRPLGATAETITPCQAYYMSVEDFRYWAKMSSPFSWQLGQLQSVRMYKLIAQRVSFRWMTARQRLEQFIWELMATQEPGRSVN
jgi:CRP-like cAMP-binding protein